MSRSISDVVFTPAVKEQQERLGSRAVYAKLEERPDPWWATTVDERLRAWVERANSFYLATANAEGQPYIQHRGGPRGFLKVLDEKTLGFADYKGNRQYVTIGNAKENDKASIFLMDYARRQRLKLWGRIQVVEDDPNLLARVTDPGYPAEKQRVILFHLEAYDGNCPQHIPRLYPEEEVEELRERIRELEAGLAT
jgi:predicted pyridoxine 5'-phosphate oxidase superfamily flavin-nucleotide-binding protein